LLPWVPRAVAESLTLLCSCSVGVVNTSSWFTHTVSSHGNHLIQPSQHTELQ
ncbi:hypothetical protein SK128_026381, partial [Halocaridina rubra]